MKKYIPIVFLSFRTDNTQNLSSLLIMWTYYFLFFNTHWWNSLSLLLLFLYFYSFLFFRGFFDDINKTFEIPLSNLLIFSYRKPKMLRRIIYKKGIYYFQKKVWACEAETRINSHRSATILVRRTVTFVSFILINYWTTCDKYWEKVTRWDLRPTILCKRITNW